MIWLATHRATLGSDRAFFVLLWEGLVACRSESFAQRRFRALNELCRLPWLDQPRRLDAAQFQGELFEAWDALCTVAVRDLASEEALTRVLSQPLRFEMASAGEQFVQIAPRSGSSVGQMLQYPISEIAATVATALGRGSVRVATHRSLVAGSAMQQLWRLIQGGRATETRGRSSSVAAR